MQLSKPDCNKTCQTIYLAISKKSCVLQLWCGEVPTASTFNEAVLSGEGILQSWKSTWITLPCTTEKQTLVLCGDAEAYKQEHCSFPTALSSLKLSAAKELHLLGFATFGGTVNIKNFFFFFPHHFFLLVAVFFSSLHYH